MTLFRPFRARVDRTATHPQGFTLGWHIPPFQGESGDPAVEGRVFVVPDRCAHEPGIPNPRPALKYR